MRGSVNKIMFSSASVEWATPDYLFNALDKIYHFDLDPCATKENAKCDKFFTEADDGLTKSWARRSVFMNPPYARGTTEKWVKKAYDEYIYNDAAVVVALLPARTDTKWFWRYCRYGQIYFLKGRVKFLGGGKNSATFPSMIVVFNKYGMVANPNTDIFSLDHEAMKLI